MFLSLVHTEIMLIGVIPLNWRGKRKNNRVCGKKMIKSARLEKGAI